MRTKTTYACIHADTHTCAQTHGQILLRPKNITKGIYSWLSKKKRKAVRETLKSVDRSLSSYKHVGKLSSSHINFVYTPNL